MPRVAHVVFGRSKTDFVVLGFPGDSVTVRTFTKPETLRRLYAEGTVETSLWDAIVGNGTDPIIAPHAVRHLCLAGGLLRRAAG